MYIILLLIIIYTKRGKKKNGTHPMGKVLAENLRTLLSASIAFVRTNAKWAKPKTLYKQKEQE